MTIPNNSSRSSLLVHAWTDELDQKDGQALALPLIGDLSSPSSFLYLLVSGQCRGSFKLGVTDALGGRLNSLRYSFGPFDLSASHLVSTLTKREALWLERTLGHIFAATHWRAPAPQLFPGDEGRARVADNGHTEWYRAAALPLMLRLIGQIGAWTAPGRRFRLQHGIVLPDDHPFLSPATVCPEERKRLRLMRRERQNCESLARSEANFKFVQEWVSAHRSRIAETQRPEPPDAGGLRRTLLFHHPAIPPALSGEDKSGCERLLAAGSVHLGGSDGSWIMQAYVEWTRLHRDHGLDAVHFHLEPQFVEGCVRVAPGTDLPRRIWDWVRSL